jgi:hypothetical protein
MMRSVAVWVLIACALFVSGPVRAQTPPLIPLEVGLGDVSLTKLIFLVAYDAGVYTKDGLDVHQYITPREAEVVRRSGVIVPPQFIRTSTGNDVPITIEGGSPRLVEMTTSALAPDRVIIATTDNTARFHIISRSDITSPEQLKGKRLGLHGVWRDHAADGDRLGPEDGLETRPRHLATRRRHRVRRAQERPRGRVRRR